ncbi:MAG: hypothetical protein KDN19_15305 [Verrucomicrobiae bacterium]|nr:hypothetical protein [Verrucomicrobiae bacterium]
MKTVVKWEPPLWAEPSKIVDDTGVWSVRTAEPTELFWSIWEQRQCELKELGVSLGQDESGAPLVEWWRKSVKSESPMEVEMGESAEGRLWVSSQSEILENEFDELIEKRYFTIALLRFLHRALPLVGFALGAVALFLGAGTLKWWIIGLIVMTAMGSGAINLAYQGLIRGYFTGRQLNQTIVSHWIFTIALNAVSIWSIARN